MKVLQLIIFAGVFSVYGQDDTTETVTPSPTPMPIDVTVQPTDAPTTVQPTDAPTTTVQPTDSPTPLVPPQPEVEETEDEYVYDYDYEGASDEAEPLINEVDECTPYGQEVSCALEAENKRCAWIPKGCREQWRPECDTFATATRTLGAGLKVYSPEQRRMARKGMVMEIAVAMSPSKIIKFAMSGFGAGRRLQDDDGYCCGQAPDCTALSTSECEDHSHCKLTHHLTDSCSMEATCYPKEFTPPMPQCHLSDSSLPDTFVAANGSTLNSGNCASGYFSYGPMGWEWSQCDMTKWYNRSKWYWPKWNGNFGVCKWRNNTGKCEIVRENQF